MQLNGIDLFAGAGGLSEGFIEAGFNIFATIEKERWACETQKTRHIFHHLKILNALDEYWNYCRATRSIEQIEWNRKKIYDRNPGLQEKIAHTIWQAEFSHSQENPECSANSEKVIQLLENSLRHNNITEIDFILGGPPCQAYSLVGRGRMKDDARNDKRNFLFKSYYDIVRHFRPKFFLFENVPGIVSARDGEIFRIIQEDFNKVGYIFLAGKDQKNIQNNIQNALYFGVPQNRNRFLFLGIRSDIKMSYPKFNNQTNTSRICTRCVIGDLPFLKPQEGQDLELIEYKNPPESEYQEEMRDGSLGVMNHRARPLNKLYDQQIYRIAILKAARNQQLDYSTLPQELKKHKNEESFTDRFKVHWWEKIPHTIVAHLSKDGHYNIHPDIKQLRSITVREAARIQSFPDNFRFEGSRTAQFVQVGNAVPPKMAKAFAEAIKRQLQRDPDQ